ncbi:hypothetical protein ABZ897_53705 [Nonomuraea sp. NPDC046802]|uniref:hypothetical protein n=1 Tax=Nonomuraea sp. NPDC046802 TaxID=3154919 RepID=UPI00340BEC3D
MDRPSAPDHAHGRRPDLAVTITITTKLRFAGRRVRVEIKTDAAGRLYPALHKPWDPGYPRIDLAMEEVAFYRDNANDRWFYYPDDALNERPEWEGYPDA